MNGIHESENRLNVNSKLILQSVTSTFQLYQLHRHRFLHIFFPVSFQLKDTEQNLFRLPKNKNKNGKLLVIRGYERREPETRAKNYSNVLTTRVTETYQTHLTSVQEDTRQNPFRCSKNEIKNGRLHLRLRYK